MKKTFVIEIECNEVTEPNFEDIKNLMEGGGLGNVIATEVTPNISPEEVFKQYAEVNLDPYAPKGDDLVLDMPEYRRMVEACKKAFVAVYSRNYQKVIVDDFGGLLKPKMEVISPEELRQGRPMYMNREDIKDLVEKIQDKVDKMGFKGQNEYDLHLREEIADSITNLFKQGK